MRQVLYVINHSGGKDSQAMYLSLRDRIPIENILVIHADLPGADWDGIDDHIKNTIYSETPYIMTKAVKTFKQMVYHRNMFPSPKNRQCTSDLKRGPIEKEIRRYAKHKGFTYIVNCMGMRADESSGRSKLKPFKFNARNSKAGRRWFDWLPIHKYTEQKVFEIIEQANQSPHWAYLQGMTRLSCVFCIMASKGDIQTAARLMPDRFLEYVQMEKDTEHTMFMPTKKHGRQTLINIVEG